MTPVQHQVCVQLIRYDPQVVTQDDLTKFFQLTAGEHAARRVLRVAEDEHAGGRGYRFFELRQVEAPVALDVNHRVVHHCAAGSLHRHPERWIHWRLDYHFITGARQSHGSQVQAGDDARGRQHLLFAVADAVPVKQVGGDSLEQAGHPAGRRVAEVITFGVIPDRLTDRLRDREVHVRYPQGQDVLRKVVPFRTAG